MHIQTNYFFNILNTIFWCVNFYHWIWVLGSILRFYFLLVSFVFFYLLLVMLNRFLHYAGLKKLFACRHLTVGWWVGSIGRDFFYFVKVSLVPRSLPLFNLSWSQEKEPLSATIDSDKALVTQCNKGIRFNLWTTNNRGITKCLYFDLSLWDIFTFYLLEQANIPEAVIIYLGKCHV